MKPKISILANGLSIISQRNPVTSIINLGVWIKVGSRHETLKQNGLAHLCEHMTFKGTHVRSEIEINEQIADIGGSSEAWTTSNNTSFCLEVLHKDLEFAIELLADIVINSKMDNKDIDAEKEVILQEMYEDQNDEDDTFDDEFAKLIYGEQSLGRDILGTEETLKSFSKQDLQAFRAKYYTASNMVLSVSGNIQHEELIKLVEKYFIGLSKGEIIKTEKQFYQGGFKHLKPDNQRVMFRIGFNLSPNSQTKTTAAKILMNQILGGEENSRLNTEVRIKKSLAYDISCSVENEIDVGFVSISAEAQTKNINPILEIVATEICKIKTQLVTEIELNRAKQQMIVNLTKRSEENDSCYAVSAEQWVAFGKLQPLNKLIELILSITTEDIQKAANEVFNSKLTYLMHGNIHDYYDYEKLTQMTLSPPLH